jgi:acyl carrier protein
MNTLDQVIQIVADCLNLSPSVIDKESSADNIDVWDSMAQVNLMIALEQSFDIELEVEDFMKLNSVQAIANYLDAKL